MNIEGKKRGRGERGGRDDEGEGIKKETNWRRGRRRKGAKEAGGRERKRGEGCGEKER